MERIERMDMMEKMATRKNRMATRMGRMTTKNGRMATSIGRLATRMAICIYIYINLPIFLNI